MSLHLAYCKPPSQSLKIYAADLYARRTEAEIAPRQDILVGEWIAKENNCHDNAILLAEEDVNYIAIHGWLYFDFGGHLPFVRFIAHSIVQRNDGKLIDVTPTYPGAPLYPFIRSNLTEDQFADVVDFLTAACGSSNCLDHWLG